MPNYEVIVPFRKCYQITADSPEEAKAWLEGLHHAYDVE